MGDTPEQRSELRLLDQLAVFIELESSPSCDRRQKICATNTIDISANGLQIVTENALPINSIHQLYIEVAELEFNLVAEVSWVKNVADEVSVGLLLLESEQTDIEDWKNYICERLSRL